MNTVTIEGTTMPAAGVLARGQRKTVAYTARIKRLVDRGFVKIVEVHTDLPSRNGDREPDTPLPVGEFAPADDPDEDDSDDDGVVDEPGRNASRDTWREFLTAQGIPYPEDAGRDDLVAGWVHISQQRAGGS